MTDPTRAALVEIVARALHHSFFPGAPRGEYDSLPSEEREFDRAPARAILNAIAESEDYVITHKDAGVGYDTCSACVIHQHSKCDGEARIHHVGGSIETVPCKCAVAHNDVGGVGRGLHARLRPFPEPPEDAR